MIRRVLPKITTMTRAWRLLVVMLLALGSVLGVYYGYLSNSGEVVQIFDGELPGPALVIAPHSDDEVLGAGGVIQRHLAQGDRVVVVLLTNGDGQYRGPLRHRTQAIQFGYLRQQETRKALQQLGVPEENVIFLGYPDRGLSQLWNHYWSCERLYTSPQTGANRSPYLNSFTPEAAYCGSSLAQDLEELILRERPKIIYLPHPNDLHADHWSAHAFVLYALERLKLAHPQGELFQETRLFAYLVHYGRWPMPRGKFLNTELKLPRSLSHMDTRWLSIPLTREQSTRKYKAILAYQSQMQYMPLYLISFARRNELFGEVPILRFWDHSGIQRAQIHSEVSSDGLLQEHSALSYPDPRHYTLIGGLRGYNDIQAIHLARGADGRLVIEVKLFEPLRSSNDVLVHLKTIGFDGSLPETWRFLRAGGRLYLNGELARDRQIDHHIRGNTFALSLPFEALGQPKAFLVGAELMRKGVTFSKAAYRLVELAP